MTPSEREAVRQTAIDRAHRLRDETIDDLWRGAERWLADAADHPGRAADRLAARLRQHARRRAAAPSSGTTSG